MTQHKKLIQQKKQKNEKAEKVVQNKDNPVPCFFITKHEMKEEEIKRSEINI